MSRHTFQAPVPPSGPLHRHQSSLEGTLDFSALPELNSEDRKNAGAKLQRIAEFFEREEASWAYARTFSRSKLIRTMLQYSVSPSAQDTFLRAFYKAISAPLIGPDPDLDQTRPLFFGFVDYLFDNFFLPIRASGNKTPDPSPTLHSAVRSVRSSSSQQGYIGTPTRLAHLRSKCLTRDRFRCVISRSFDVTEATSFMNLHGSDARDVDGNPVLDVPAQKLEVAHILPHGLAKLRRDDGKLDEAKQAALSILNMFDTGVSHLIQGVEVDQPRNAISLTSTHRELFGKFQICFEEIDEPHQYSIKGFGNAATVTHPRLPITRKLFLMADKSIDPPSPRLLKIHWAIAHILHLSGAGDYIEKLLHDFDEHGIRSDGSTNLGQLVNLRVAGWTVGTFS